MKNFLILIMVAIFISVAFAGNITSKFERMITKTVIREAIQTLDNDLSGEFSYTDHYGITWSAGVGARHAVWHKLFGDDWFNRLYSAIAVNIGWGDYWSKPGYDDEKTFNVFESTMERAREALKNPEDLKRIYHENRNYALNQVEQRAALKEKLTELLNNFSLMPGPYKSTREQYYHEFASRRHAEGGDELVEAYREIIQDFIDIL